MLYKNCNYWILGNWLSFTRSSELPSDDIDETEPVLSSIPISSFLESLVRRCL